ncbi:MAG: YraN family protein [Bacteroidales bacterium]|nr:YraN family protein [Bacteroidales bacterium]
MEKDELGRKGEQLAADYLKDNGFTVLSRNWHFGHLEVDVIAENNEFVVFCEVKTRSSTVMGSPEEFVTAQKQKNLIRAASRYLQITGKKKEVRFDIISVVANGEKFTVSHMPRAFEPQW